MHTTQYLMMRIMVSRHFPYSRDFFISRVSRHIPFLRDFVVSPVQFPHTRDFDASPFSRHVLSLLCITQRLVGRLEGLNVGLPVQCAQ